MRQVNNKPSDEDVRTLSEVSAWLFDLDNTLYDSDQNFFQNVSERMTIFVANYFGIDATSAKELQRYYYEFYGTTLTGLMKHDGVDPDQFLQFTHEINYSLVPKRPALVNAIHHLPGSRFVFTNGPRFHALSTLKALGFRYEFTGIQDIADAHYIPKPAPEPYQHLIASYQLSNENLILFEDLPQNLIVPKQMGMKTVMITGKNGLTSFGKPLESLTDDIMAPVDWVIDDLPTFLSHVWPNSR